MAAVLVLGGEGWVGEKERGRVLVFVFFFWAQRGTDVWELFVTVTPVSRRMDGVGLRVMSLLLKC